jgi:ribosome-associated protein
MTQEAAAKKDTQRLQRAIVDGLEDVKAQDITVFNTEHLSPLFERVIVASGTSNRQTKALAASVRDAVREAGFPKPRIEGEENGEWIIVDCGAAVAHIMQPAIRQYYHLEEIWGEKPVRLKFGSPKPAMSMPESERPAAKKTPAKKATAKTAAKATAKKAGTGGTARTPAAPMAKAPAKKAPAKNAPARKASAPARKPAAKNGPASSARSPAKGPAKSSARSAAKSPARSPSKSPAKKG